MRVLYFCSTFLDVVVVLLLVVNLVHYKNYVFSDPYMCTCCISLLLPNSTIGSELDLPGKSTSTTSPDTQAITNIIRHYSLYIHLQTFTTAPCMYTMASCAW